MKRPKSSSKVKNTGGGGGGGFGPCSQTYCSSSPVLPVFFHSITKSCGVPLKARASAMPDSFTWPKVPVTLNRMIWPEGAPAAKTISPEVLKTGNRAGYRVASTNQHSTRMGTNERI